MLYLAGGYGHMLKQVKQVKIKLDDLKGGEVVSLLDEHYRDMLLHSPPESVHTLDTESLHSPSICFWSIWLEGRHKILQSLPLLIEDMANNLSFDMRELLNDLLEELKNKNIQIKDIEEKIKFLSKKCKGFENLMNMPGIGLINSSALVSAIGDAKQFSSARGFAAFLGLVPKHEQSGTKLKSMGISKNGNCYLRTLLIHGARAIVNRYQNTDDPLKKFAMKIKEKRGAHKAYVAVAHKMSRIIWAMLSKDQAYNPDYILTRK